LEVVYDCRQSAFFERPFVDGEQLWAFHQLPAPEPGAGNLPVIEDAPRLIRARQSRCVNSLGDYLNSEDDMLKAR
jgi:hypothetical protein